MTIIDEVLSFIHAPDPDRFEELALRVFRYQVAHVAPYREYCRGRGVEPNTLRALGEVPCVSTVAFKYASMESSDVGETPESRLFLTSGTTVGKSERGRHLVLRPDIYRASAMRHMRRMLFADGRRTAMLALHPTADRMPESSLSQMISWCIEEFGTGRTCYPADREGVDTGTAIRFLHKAAKSSEAVTILTTTAAFAALVEALKEADGRVELPSGSRLMDTGGAKGQIVPLTSAEVIAAAERWLRLDPALVVNEYGMTEMCSQLYSATSFNAAGAPGIAGLKLAPPWLRAVSLDPVTLKPLGGGQIGLLGFFDLANVASVSALMTEDLGFVRDGGVGILGRAAAAEPRGCALALAEFAENEPSGNAVRAL